MGRSQVADWPQGQWPLRQHAQQREGSRTVWSGLLACPSLQVAQTGNGSAQSPLAFCQYCVLCIYSSQPGAGHPLSVRQEACIHAEEWLSQLLQVASVDSPAPVCTALSHGHDTIYISFCDSLHTSPAGSTAPPGRSCIPGHIVESSVSGAAGDLDSTSSLIEMLARHLGTE